MAEMKVKKADENGFDHSQKIGQRIWNATGEVYTLDWMGDKVLPKINAKFVSKGKMLRQLAPILWKYGITISIKEEQPIFLPAVGSKDSHCMVGMTMRFINADDVTDFVEDSAWGEGADMMDKAVSIASAYALRTILLTKFLIADGIEPDDLVNPPMNGFKPMSKEEEEEVMSAVIGRAIPNDKPTETPAKTEEVKKEVAKPTEVKKEPVKAETKLSKIMQTAFNNACKEVEQLMQDGRFSTEQYRVLKEAMDNVHDKDTYNSFMNIKKTAIDMLVKG